MIHICQANKRRHQKRRRQLANAEGGLLACSENKSVSCYTIEKKSSPIGK